MQIHNAIITGSFSYNGADLSNVTSSNAYSASLSSRTTDLESTSSVLVGASSSFSSVLSSVSSSQQQISSSQQQISASLLTISRSYASTGSNTFTGLQNFSNTCNPIGFNSVASVYTAGGLQVTYDSYFSSSVFVNGNLTVFGTQSVVHVSSSQFNVGTNIITVNTATPSIRYGGLSVYDSGSTGLSGSIFWDSERNHWIYANASGSTGGDTYGGGMFISGPRNSIGLGCEQGTTSCMLLVGQGGDHLTSSMIYHDSTKTCFYNNVLFISSSGQFLFGNSPADFSFNVATTCVGTNATIAQFYNNDYTSGTRGFIRVRNSANISATTSAYFGQGQDQKTYFYNNDPSRAGDIVITGTGLVGIGTCTPISQLTIAASNSTTAGNICTALSLAGIRLFPISGTTNGLSIGIAGANTNYLQAQYASDCSAAPLALQPYNGNVGISTVTPTNGKLEVQTTNTSAGLWVQTGGTTSGYTIADFRTGTNASALQILGNSNSIFGGATSFLNNLCVNGDVTVRGRTTTWGTISLFPDNPGGCNGSSGNTVLLGSVVGCAGYGPQLRFSGATSGEFIDIGQTSTGGFVIEGTDNPRLIITNCGSVGIGCVSPLHNLDIGSVRTNIGGFAFCNIVTAQGTWSTFACVGADANVVTTITYTNTNDHNRSGVFIARWAYNDGCASLFIRSCLWNDSQNIATLAFRNFQSGALQICVSGGGGDYRVQALTQGTKAT